MSNFDYAANLELLKKARENDIEAYNQFIKNNSRLVRKIAFSYSSSRCETIEIDDLIQEGNVGLILAMQKFDFSRDIKFSTYAAFWIKNRIQLFIVSQRSGMGMSIYTSQRLIKLIHIKEKYLSENVKVSKEVLAKELEVSLDELKFLESILNSKVVSSSERYQNNTSDSELLIEDTIADEFNLEEEAMEKFKNDRVREVLKRNLKPREYLVICKYYGFDGKNLNLQEIANELGITRERVRQIACKALHKLQKVKQEFIR